MNRLVFLGLLVGGALTVFGIPIEKRSGAYDNQVTLSQLDDKSTVIEVAGKVIHIEAENGTVHAFHANDQAAKQLLDLIRSDTEKSFTAVETTITLEKFKGDTLVRDGKTPKFLIEHPSGNIKTLNGLEDFNTSGNKLRYIIDLVTGKVQEDRSLF